MPHYITLVLKLEAPTPGMPFSQHAEAALRQANVLRNGETVVSCEAHETPAELKTAGLPLKGIESSEVPSLNLQPLTVRNKPGNRHKLPGKDSKTKAAYAKP